MKAIVFTLIFLSGLSCFGQKTSKEERQKKLDNKKEGIDSFELENGLFIAENDTIYIQPNLNYYAVYEGRGISLKKLGKNDNVIMTVIKSIKDKTYGVEIPLMAICKGENNSTYSVSVNSGLKLKEISLSESKMKEKERLIEERRTSDPNYQGFDFRGVTWKNNRKEILDIHKDLEVGESSLLKKDRVAGLNVILYYGLNNDDRLKSCGYLVKEEHTNKNLYIEDYERLKNILTEKYGTPAKEEEYWRDDLFKGDYSSYGTAISRGDLSYETKWELPDTDIYLRLKGDNYKINLGIVYFQFPEIEEAKKVELNKF